ncbi:30S ribosomal protein S8, partial [Eubacterium pyruvativorans]|uniref:30S ribosomal protein S8 n=1 Tax=Eubacterium pyruvativorans TaxID=155865 RepID=UPI0023F180A2
MTMTDPIADMLTRIRNANTVGHETVEIPATKMKKAIAQILLDEGYITAYDITEDGVKSTMTITMKYGANREK